MTLMGLATRRRTLGVKLPEHDQPGLIGVRLLNDSISNFIPPPLCLD